MRAKPAMKDGRDPLRRPEREHEERRLPIFTSIIMERHRQQKRFGLVSIAGDISLDTKLRILAEEVGEVAQAIDVFLGQPQNVRRRKALRDELVQVAACAVGMLEAL